MLLVEAAVQRLDVSNVLLVCFAGDVEKRITIRLNGLNVVPCVEHNIVTFTAYTRPLTAPIPV
jgi:hypothetical protein